MRQDRQTSPEEHSEPGFDRWLEQHAHRGGPDHARRRLAMEAAKAKRLRVRERPWPLTTDMTSWVDKALLISGCRGLARRNADAIELEHHRLPVTDLPDAFEGLRLLQISDPHFSDQTHLTDALLSTVQTVEHDVCVLTGDYRYRSFGCNALALDGLERLRKVLPNHTVAILGNHDSLYTLPAMEAMGYQVLLNESCIIERGGRQLALLGVDDPSYYRLDDLARTLESAHKARARVLLAHSPDLAGAAARCGVGAYLCGHTHGGQICLPGGTAVLSNTRAPRRMHAGPWKQDDMHGYTSRGAGVSIVHARLFCPPEVTLHTLTRR